MVDNAIYYYKSSLCFVLGQASDLSKYCSINISEYLTTLRHAYKNFIYFTITQHLFYTLIFSIINNKDNDAANDNDAGDHHG